MKEQGNFEEITDSLKNYVATTIELNKLKLIDRTAHLGSGIIFGMIVALFATLSVIFLSISAGFYLSSILGDTFTGFAIVGGFYLLILLILLLARKKLVDQTLRNKIIRKVFGN